MLIIIDMNGEAENQMSEIIDNPQETNPTREEIEDWLRHMPKPELHIVPHF